MKNLLVKTGFIRVLVATLLILGMVGGASAQSPSPVFHYALDGSCPPSDSSGNGNDGSCVNNPSTGVSGQFNQAYDFGNYANNLNQPYLTTPNTGISGDHSNSIVAWMYKPDNTDPFFLYVQGEGNTDNALGIKFGSDSKSWDYNFFFFANDLQVSDSASRSQIEGNWVCFGATYDASSSERKIYSKVPGVHDTELLGSDSPSNPDFKDTQHSVGGGILNGESGGGKADEVRVFDQALSQSQIDSLCDSNTFNQAPTIDSVSTEPSSWTLGSSVNVSSEVYDSDGNDTVSSVSLDVWENGTQIVSDASLTNTAGTTWELDNAFNVDESNVYYNITIEATDDQGATTTETVSQYIPDNSPPQINEKDHTPQPEFVGDKISYTANASDPEGDNLNAWITVEEDGVIINDTVPMNEPTENNFQLQNVYTATQTGFYNATITVGDGTTNVTAEENFLLQDDKPVFTINKPKNRTYFRFNNTLKVTNNGDNDAFPNELSTCNSWNNGNFLQAFNVSEGGGKFSFNYNASLNFNTLNVSCTELNGSANTKSKQRFYTVKAFELNSLSSDATVFETESVPYIVNFTVGSMVDEYDYNLYIGGELEAFNNFLITGSGNIERGKEINNSVDVDLTENNDTSNNWWYEFDVNYTDENGVSQNLVENSSVQSQNVYQGFFPVNQTLDKNRYLERDEIKVTTFIKSKTDKPAISSNIIQNQTGEVDENNKIDRNNQFTKYVGTYHTQDINQDKLRLNISANYTIDFNSESRDFIESSQTTVNQFQLQKCSTGGIESLKFNSFNERDLNQQINTDLELALQAWNPSDPSFKRTFNFTSNNKNSHVFCISPNWTTLQVDNTQKLAQYDGIPNSAWSERRYFLLNQTINNVTTEIPIYTVWRNQSNTVTFEIEDENNEPVSQAITKIERYFPGLDKHITVAMVRTSSQGDTETNLVAGQVDYRFKVFTNGVGDYSLVETFPNQIIPQDLSVLLTIGDEFIPSYYTYFDKFGNAGCVDNATQIECSYSSNTESIKNVTLKVEQVQPIGFKTVCTRTAKTITGSLKCDGLNTSENRYKYSFFANFNNGYTFTIETGWIGQVNSDYGGTGLMISLFMFITFSFAGLWKPEASIALGLVSIILSYMIGFIAVSQTAVTAIVALAAVMIWRMKG